MSMGSSERGRDGCTETTTLTHWSNDYPAQHSQRMDYRLIEADWDRDHMEGLILIGIDSGGVERLKIAIGERDYDSQALVDALWCHTEAHAKAPGNITGLCELLAGDQGHELRDMLAIALEDISDETEGRINHDAWGHAQSGDDDIYWAATNGYTTWACDEPDWWDDRHSEVEQEETDGLEVEVTTHELREERA